MTKDTEEFSQSTDSVACREYTLPRDESLSEPKGWIRGNTEIGPVLEVTTCCLQGKKGMEIRIESMNKDHPHSWVRISHGLNKLVTKLEQQWAGNLRNAVRRLCVKIECLCFCEPIKGYCETTKTYFCQLIHKNFTYWGKNLDRYWWTTRDFSLTDNSVSKKLINLLRRGSLHREDDGAIEFWRIEVYLQNHVVHSRHWSDEKWKSIIARGGGNKKRFQYCTDSSGQEILYLRALQGHSGRNPIDPSLQDNVLIPGDFFEYICHVGCAINLHSFINSGLIPGGQILSKRQTIFFLPVNPMDKEHRSWEDRLGSTSSCTRDADRKEETSKHGVLGRHQTCSKERIKVLSNAIECHHPLQYTPSLLCPESCPDGNWRNHIRKSIWVTSTASEDFL